MIYRLLRSIHSLIICGSKCGSIITEFPWFFLKCRIRLPFSTNDLLHCGQEKGFSPLCDLRCVTKLPSQIKSLGQRSQRKGRFAAVPLLWLRIWNSKLPLSGKLLPHSSHENGLSPGHRRKRNQSSGLMSGIQDKRSIILYNYYHRIEDYRCAID